MELMQMWQLKDYSKMEKYHEWLRELARDQGFKRNIWEKRKWFSGRQILLSASDYTWKFCSNNAYGNMSTENWIEFDLILGLSN